MTILLDTNILVASAHSRDLRHAAAGSLLSDLSRSREHVIVIAPVLQELFYFITEHSHYQRAVEVYRDIVVTFSIETLTLADLARIPQIMQQYQGLETDFVDAALVAVAERLNITRIATLDRRDFSVIVPAHAEYFELLP